MNPHKLIQTTAFLIKGWYLKNSECVHKCACKAVCEEGLGAVSVSRVVVPTSGYGEDWNGPVGVVSFSQSCGLGVWSADVLTY